MTTITTHGINGTGITAPPPGLGLEQRRRVAGFSTRIECRLPEREIHRALSEMTERSAFHLSGLAAEPGAGDDRARIYRATFTLDAPSGVTGDSQIFALLRDIATQYRWRDVEKIIV